MRLFGMFIGFAAIYALVWGSWLATAKPVMESSDYALIGLALMVLSQLVINFGEAFDKPETGKPSNGSVPGN